MGREAIGRPTQLYIKALLGTPWKEEEVRKTGKDERGFLGKVAGISDGEREN